MIFSLLLGLSGAAVIVCAAYGSYRARDEDLDSVEEFARMREALGRRSRGD